MSPLHPHVVEQGREWARQHHMLLTMRAWLRARGGKRG